MHSAGLWVRWSWRDLRHRWTVVAAISLVIALGTGTYAALLSTSAWRQQSNDASFGLLHLHDLRISLAQGTTTGEGSLTSLIRGIPDASDVNAVRERLIVPTQIAGPHNLLVPGELVGTDITPGGRVDAVSADTGRPLTAADDGTLAVVVDRGFAKANLLPPQGSLRLSGDVPVRYVGQGQSPEYFLVSGGQGTLPFLTQKSFGVLFSTLHTAQRLSGSPGQVNDAVLTLRSGANLNIVRGQIEHALDATNPPVAATVTTRADVSSYEVLYRDISNDEQIWRIVAFLVLGAAAFAALNLTSRLVEAQRRELGIGMALGMPTRLIALRPLLFGAEVALIGVVLGLGVGLLVSVPLRSMFVGLVPLPIWKTPFQPGIFIQAALLGFFIPLLAVAWPVWRAIRVEPADAIRVGNLAARGGRLASLARHLPSPGRSYRQVPLRNLLRTPRRTVLTALGIAAAITTLVVTMGFLDSFNGTLDRAQQEFLHAAPSRVVVSLRTLDTASGPTVKAVSRLPQVRSVEAGLLMPTTARRGSHTVDLVTEVLAPTPEWTPTMTSGTLGPGIVLSAKAAADLHVHVGDTIALRHPVSVAGGLRNSETAVRVSGIHPNPLRMFSYMDARTAARLFRLQGITNLLTVHPVPGVEPEQVKRALLSIPEVASAQSVKDTTGGMRSSLDQYVGILQIAAAITLLLAFLIAYNTASIGLDERRREHATMLAFGLPVRSVLELNTAEALLLGSLGTAVGLAAGFAVLRWMIQTTVPRVMPDISVTANLSLTTVIVTIILGVGVVAAAPLVTTRRLRRLDIPSALRLVE